MFLANCYKLDLSAPQPWSWVPIASTPSVQRRHRLFYASGKIFSYGTSSGIYMYDIEGDKWTIPTTFGDRQL